MREINNPLYEGGIEMNNYTVLVNKKKLKQGITKWLKDTATIVAIAVWFLIIIPAAVLMKFIFPEKEVEP